MLTTDLLEEYLQRYDELKDSQDWEAAIQLTQDYLARKDLSNESKAVAYGKCAYAHAKTGAHIQATDDYKMALEVAPKEAIPFCTVMLNNLGNSYAELGRYQEAADEYDKAIEIAPDDIEAYFNKGTMYIECSDFSNAIEAFDEIIQHSKIIEHSKKGAALYHNRGYAHLGNKNHDKAIADFTEAIKLNPDNASSFHYKAQALIMKRDYDKAINISREVVSA